MFGLLKKIREQSIPLIILFLTSIGFSLTTVFSPVSEATFGHDAGIFAYIGTALTKGEILYTGAWDNKGPLLYFINALGILIDYRYGIYLLEVCTLVATSVFLYKTGLLFVSKGKALIAAIFCIMTLSVTLDGGNLSEEYSLPFTTLAFYFIAKFFKNEFVLKKYEMMLVGACIAAIFLLRLNILAFLACAVLGVIVVLINRKEYIKLATVAGFALIGFFLFATPFIIYLVVTNSFELCLDTVYLGVLGFFSKIPFREAFINIINMILRLKTPGSLYLIIFYVFVFPVCYIKSKEKASAFNILGVISYFGLAFTLLANSLSGAYHLHYFMCFVPVLIIPAVWLINFVECFFTKIHCKASFSGVISCALILLMTIGSIPVLQNNVGGFRARHISRYEVSDYLCENSQFSDRVLVIGEEASVTSYYRANRLSASNFFYYANGRFSDESKTYFADEISDDVLDVKPKLIMFETKAKMDDFLEHLTNREEWDDFVESEYSVEEKDFFYKIYKRNY